MPVTLLTEALVSIDEAKLYLKRQGLDLGDDHDDLLKELINYATGQIESPAYTGRRLVSRTYTAGTALVVSGNGTSEIYAPEYPLTAVAAVRSLDGNGTPTARVLTGMRFSPAGLIVLPHDVFPAGTRNIQIDCTAGIGLTSAQGKALQGAACRWIQVMLGDQNQGIGRGSTMSIGGASFSANFETPMPRDVERVVRGFARVGF